MSTATVPSRLAQTPTAVRALLAIIVTVVVSSLVCLAVAAVAHAAGASPDFRALMPATFIAFIVVGSVVGTIGWLIVRASARRPRALLRVLVPVVLVVSLIPDVLVGSSGASAAMPGVSWTGVVGLMLMHVVVAAVLVTALSYLLPAPEVSARSARSARSF